MTLRAAYFAWVRERIGKPGEDLSPPETVRTAGDLLAWLAGQGEEYAYAFENPDVIRIALDKKHVRHEAPIGAAREVAFFPPMTGG